MGICAFGGTSMSHEPDSASVLYNQKLTVLPPKVKDIYSNAKQGHGVAADIELAFPTGYPFSRDPHGLLFITSRSEITVFAPASGAFQHILPSPNFNLQSSRVTCTLFSNVSQAFLSDLLQYGDVSWEPRSWPILGGSSS